MKKSYQMDHGKVFRWKKRHSIKKHSNTLLSWLRWLSRSLRCPLITNSPKKSSSLEFETSILYFIWSLVQNIRINWYHECTKNFPFNLVISEIENGRGRFGAFTSLRVDSFHNLFPLPCHTQCYPDSHPRQAVLTRCLGKITRLRPPTCAIHIHFGSASSRSISSMVTSPTIQLLHICFQSNKTRYFEFIHSPSTPAPDILCSGHAYALSTTYSESDTWIWYPAVIN